MIKVYCNGTRIQCLRQGELNVGMAGAPIEFDFSSEWDGLAKTAVFRCDGERDMIIGADGKTTVPYEILTTPGMDVEVGVYAVKEDGTTWPAPTTYCKIGRVGEGADPSVDGSYPPTPDVGEQAVAAASKALQAAASAQEVAAEIQRRADAGEFDGKPGEPGKDGEPGEKGEAGGYYTPSVTQEDDMLRFSFASSEEDMPAVGDVVVDLPGGSVDLDTTLTQTGKAADAKAVGDALEQKQDAGNYLTDHNTFVGGVNTSSAAFYEAFSARKPCFLLRPDAGGGMVMWVAHDCTSRAARFYNVASDGTVRYATLEGSVFSYESAAGGSGNVFVGDENTTVAEFAEADQAGKVCFMKRPQGGSGITTWVAYNCHSGGASFYHVNSIGTVNYGRLGSDGSWNYTSAKVDVDTTLTQSGKAADAKAVGDALANVGGGVTVEPAEDDIPKVFLTGTLPTTKDEVTMGFRYISKTEDVAGYVEIKCQGNSSMSYPKKNFTVKMFADEALTEKMKVDFKGWGKQNKHVYKANWIDITHARNVVSARLWADVVKSRASYAELPELLRTSPNQGAMDGFPIKVYANGVYQGRYTLNIPKDKWAFNMDDDLATHCVLCGENYVSGCFRAAANINESDWTDEIHDTVPASIKTRWNEVISFVMNSTDADFKASLGNYFDVESLLDYHLFGLVSCGLDAYGKNQIYMTYDGQKWIASMYDMDSTWGLWWTGQSFVATDYDRSEYQDFKDGEGNLLYIRLENLFYEELQARWAELRSGALSIENIINRFERFTDIAPAELVKEDYASTTGDGKFTGIPSKTTSTIQQIRGYAVARHAWCDTYVAGLTPSEEVPCTGITLSASTLTFTEAGSQTLTATIEPADTTDSVVWSVSPIGIATVSGGVVTAVANGSCTITATCGEQSATCAVSVSGIGEQGGEEDAEIDYTLNPLANVEWTLGSYTTSDGSHRESTTDYRTDKFELQNCVYDFQLGGVNTWGGLYIWNENDEYVGGMEMSGSVGKFVAKAGWKYAIKANGYPDTLSLLPVDQSANASGISTVTVDGAAETWVKSGNYGSEVVISDVMAAAGFAANATFNEIGNKINKCSHHMFLTSVTTSQFVGTGADAALVINAYNGGYYLVVLDVDAADAPALVGTVTIN